MGSTTRVRRTDAAETDAPATVRVTRADRGELLRPHIRESDGLMFVEGIAVKESILSYQNRDGSITREYVPESTIRASADGIAHLPLTLEHPTDENGHPIKVTPENVDRLSVGNVDSEVHVTHGGFTKVRMAVRSRKAQDAIHAGKRELSLAYDAEVAMTPGRNHLGEYDAVQISRTYDALAIVGRARVGPDASFRFDGITVDTLTQPAGKSRGDQMDPELVRALALAGITRHFDSVTEAAKALADHMAARRDSASAEQARIDSAAVEAKSKLTAAEAARDSEKARADGLAAEVERFRLAEKTRTDAAERAEDESLATALGIDAKAHADAKALKRAIATKHLGGTMKADADDAYVAVVVDIARTSVASRTDGRKAGADAWTVPADAQRTDGADTGTRTDAYLSPAQMVAKRNADAFNAASGRST